MSEPRRQGRPRTEDGLSGQSVVDRARNALRTAPYDVASRKELAAAAGVTPALVSYYFPTGNNLPDIILSPIMYEHSKSVYGIVRSHLSPKEKALQAADYLISAFRQDRNIINAYIAYILKGSPAENYIDDIQSAIGELMRECGRHGMSDGYPMPVRHGAFWGMCSAAARLDRGLTTVELEQAFWQ